MADMGSFEWISINTPQTPTTYLSLDIKTAEMEQYIYAALVDDAVAYVKGLSVTCHRNDRSTTLRATLIVLFVGYIRNLDRAKSGHFGNELHVNPSVVSVSSMYQYSKINKYKTNVAYASFRTTC
ncbi:hypothetical protein PC115_g17072 [Phytophthora cactorum]|uniref:Uncharacterized protein n=1 Tax=Phytophthora cactorum TaxID=29920 RepID=A0A8T1BAL8_9STRA|nr:hypothetical protein PC115_g17072 [Phytophthora cactorum]